MPTIQELNERVRILEIKVFGQSNEDISIEVNEPNMERFDKVFDDLIGHEGGYVNDPADAGGATKWGVSLRFYKDRINSRATASTIKALTRDDAKNIYYKYFWQEPQFEKLPLGVGELTFNFGVNMGASRGIKLLQQALNDNGQNVAVDGVLGPQTIGAANRTNRERLIAGIGLFAIRFYESIATGSNVRFKKGWLYRAVMSAMEAYGYTISASQ